jgi:hypothetical protein
MSGRARERRKHERKVVACAVSVYDRGGKAVATGRTVNLSDGGALLSVPIRSVGEVGSKVNVTLSVPRTTPNTYMLEEVASAATVVRQQPLVDAAFAGVALRFDRPLDLALEV